MRWMVAVVTCALAACAQTPAQVREGQDVLKVALKGDWRTAAACVHRQMEYQPSFNSALLLDEPSRSAEIVVKNAGSTMWLVDVAESPQGTVGLAYQGNDAMFMRETWRERLRSALAPCQ